MIIIQKNKVNTLSLSMNDNIVLDNPHFIFEFIDVYNRIVTKELVNTSNVSRYQQFLFTEGTDITLNENGTYKVYESDISTNVLLGGENILEQGEFEIVSEIEQDIFFDTDFYDNTQPDLIPLIHEWKIIQDASGWLMTDSSWNYVNTLLNAVDASSAALYNIIQDASITNLNSTIGSINSSINKIDTSLTRIDSSINYLFNNTSGVSQSYVDGSLGKRDLQIISLQNQINDVAAIAYAGLVLGG